ncbi:MAG: T9SS type A sorting domain-containing protein [Bacteroidia bacterium]|nr:T9SS type A sorting domain-containing protein [Bacteroidia bacterium]
MFEIVPNKATVAVISSGNTVTAPEMTLTDYNTNYLNYESELIKLTDVTFPSANGILTFGSGAGTNLTDGTTTISFRTFTTGESDIVGSIIPSDHIKLTCIGTFNNTTVQVYGRTLVDFMILPTRIEKTSSTDKIRMYPVPATSVLNISNVPNLRSIEIMDAAGKVIKTINTSSDELIQIPVASLRRGMYIIRFNTANGKVVKRFVKS